MVHAEKKLVFIHVPRTGGQTVKEAFGADGEWEWGVTHYCYAYQRELLEKAERSLCLDYVHFAVVRNPWDKMVSMWEYRRYHKDRESGTRDLDFEDWVRWIYDEGREGYWTDKCHNELDVEFALGDCLNWVEHELTPAQTRQFRYLRFERLEAQVRALAELAGVQVAELFPRKNASLERLHADYREYYQSEDVIRLVGAHHEKDVERFGYKFEQTGKELA